MESTKERMNRIEKDIRRAMIEAGAPGRRETQALVRAYRARKLASVRICPTLTVNLLKVAASVLLLLSVSGCVPAIGDWVPATGWRLSVGVDPVDSLSDTRELNQRRIQASPAPLQNPKGRY